MPVQVVCPHCSAKLAVKDELAGRTARCPHCSRPVRFDRDSLANHSLPPKIDPVTPASDRYRARRQGVPPTHWVVFATSIVVALGVGFFAGREYLKWEIRSAIGVAMGGMADALSGDSPPGGSSAGPESGEEQRRKSLIRVEYIGQDDARFGTQLSFRLVNASGKDIASLKGGVSIYDQFDERIEGLAVTLDDPLPATAETVEAGNWMTSDRANRLLEEGKARVTFRADRVIYADGTEERF